MNFTHKFKALIKLFLLFRHPLPDEYELNLDIAKNIATPAREFPCDSKSVNVPDCPDSYKDGDMYVFQRLDRLCPKVREHLVIL